MPKLFCSYRVGLESAFYGTSKLVLTSYFCEPLLIIVREKGLIKTDYDSTGIFIHSYLWEILSNNIYSIFDKNKQKAVNRMLLRSSWKLFITNDSKWRVFQKETFHLTSTIYLLLRCSTEKQTQLYTF